MQLASIQAVADADIWQLLAVVVKTLTYGASLGAAGGAIFLALFDSRISARRRDEFRRSTTCLAVAGILFSVLRIAITNGMMTGELAGMIDPAMTRMVLESSEGFATVLRIAGLLLIAVSVAKRSRASQSGVSTGISLTGALLAATSFALVGHAGEVAGSEGSMKLPQALLCLHLLAVAFWLGALWPLHQVTYDDDVGKIAAIMHRFGKAAAIFVGLLVVAGVLLLWLIIGSVAALWESAYGQLVLVKLFLVALLLTLAALNKLRLTPALLRGERTGIPKLRRSIRAEMAIAGIILLCTAAFTTVVGPAGLG